MRQSWCVWLFAAALLGMAATTLYNFVLTNGAEVMGTGGAIFTAVIWLVAIFLFLYARKLAKRGVLV